MKFVLITLIFSATTCLGQSVLVPKVACDSNKCLAYRAKIYFQSYKINCGVVNSRERNSVTTNQRKSEWKNDILPCYGGTSFRTSSLGRRQFKIPYDMWARQYDYSLVNQ